LDDITQALAEFSPDKLLIDPRTVDSGIYLVFLGLFIALFLIGLALSLMPDRFARGNRLLRRLYGLYGAWVAWLAGAGILVVGLRYVTVPLFSKRLWTLLSLLTLIAVGLHALWYRLARYPDEREDYMEEERRRRHIYPARRRRR